MAKDLDLAYLIDTYGCLLTEKQLEVVELYYNEDLSLSEIAQNSGISRQGVRDSIKRAETAMREFEDKLGFAARRRELQQLVDRIRYLAQEIIIENGRYSISMGIENAAREIVAVTARIPEAGRED